MENITSWGIVILLVALTIFYTYNNKNRLYQTAYKAGFEAGYESGYYDAYKRWYH